MAVQEAPSVQVIQQAETAATLFSPARMKILELLGSGDTAAGVARKMGLPRQQVTYHLRELESAGLVELVEERRKGNCLERVVRAAARSFVISPEALGKLGATPAEQRDRFSVGFLVHLAARAIADLAVICARAKTAGKRVATMGLETEVRFASAEARSAFAMELTEQVARLTAKYHDEGAAGGRRFRFIGGVYPAITR
jgi:DNA-binding transcriptional ArsR family regulator